MVAESVGVGITPGPSQWNTAEPVTPSGKVREQVRVTVSPATMDKGEVLRVTLALSEKNLMCLSNAY